MTNTATTNTATTDLEHLIDMHLTAYAEPDAVRRAALIAEAWHTDGELIDPPFDGKGHVAIGGMTDVVLAHYPGHSFRRSTAIDSHHNFARYGWELVAADGTVATAGLDVVEIGDDGRIARIVGFFGTLS